VTPDAEDTPTGCSQRLGGRLIAGNVARDFALPILAVVLRHTAVVPAAVPEAAVNEDGKSGASENEIGTAGEWLVATPAGDVCGSKN